jgi:hypothetical protein
MTKTDAKFLCCGVGRKAPFKKSVIGVRNLGFPEAMGLLLSLRQEKDTNDTLQLTNQLAAEPAD